MANINVADWTYGTAAHLLRRAAFGHNGHYSKTSGEAIQVRHLARKTPDQAVDSLLRFAVSKAMGPGRLDTSQEYFDKLQTWWLDRMIKNSLPVREKIVLFLHTHFATAKLKVSQS